MSAISQSFSICFGKVLSCRRYTYGEPGALGTLNALQTTHFKFLQTMHFKTIIITTATTTNICCIRPHMLAIVVGTNTIGR